MNTLVRELQEKLKLGYSLMEFCEEKSLSYNKTYHIIKKLGIILPKQGTSRKSKIVHEKSVKYNIQKDELIKLYENDKLSVKQIAKRYGCSVSIIHKLLVKYNIKRRTKSEAAQYQWTSELRNHFRKLCNNGLIGVNYQKNRGFRGNTSIEKDFIRWCVNNHIDYKQQQQIISGGHQYDFLICGHKVLVEVDGLYWHRPKKQQEKDKIQMQEAYDLGYVVYRFSDKEILDSKGECFDRLFEIVG